ncbi:MAG: hypothetical protein V4689_06460 [Verrucomicrobiota bacterium]
MKTYIPYSLLLAAAASGVAFGAETAYTTPVGYETLPLASGFNYVGIRTHSPTVAAGTFETVTATTLTDTGSALGTTLDDATSYIIEITGGNGAITNILGAAAVGDAITVTDNLTSVGVANGAAYRIRPASTLSSIFGSGNSAGLAAGFFGPGGADLVYVPSGGGNFTIYYYDDGIPGWADGTGAGVDPSAITLIYTDTLIVATGAPLNLTVSGEVKKDSTLLALDSGFNYAASVYPAGATLASEFGLTSPPNLDYGFFGPGGADLVYLPNGAGGFNIYYYDDGIPGWADGTGAGVDAATVNLTPGVIIANENGPVNLKANAPSSYSSL